MAVDTHTHLYMPEFSAEGQPEGSYEGQCAAVDRAVEAGVRMMLFPNVNADTIEPMKAVHAMRPEVTAMAMGLHPTELDERWRDSLEAIRNELYSNPGLYKAVGEIGIDLYWDKKYEGEQMEVLDTQLGWASELGLPVIIHCREGLAQSLEVLQGHRDVPAVFHCFGGSMEDVGLIRRTGDYYFGIGGIVTFKNSDLRNVLPQIGTERLLTETDSPYLAPVPHRGKRNESAYIPLILNSMAAALGMSPEALEKATVQNANNLFKL